MRRLTLTDARITGSVYSFDADTVAQNTAAYAACTAGTRKLKHPTSVKFAVVPPVDFPAYAIPLVIKTVGNLAAQALNDPRGIAFFSFENTAESAM